MKTLRHLHLRGATGAIRAAEYDGREHLVVPVTAMVEGVVWAINAEAPEFVPAEELAQTPHQWNGRACFAGHPKDGGTQVTANTPQTLEKSFGMVFGTSSAERILSSRRLEMEAWLDPVKAEMVGPDAIDVIKRLNAGEVVEVSVGCYVEAEQIDGVFGGLEYHGVWRNIVSDHLALLASNETGACSVAAGCGAGRAAIRHLVSAEGIRREEVVDPVTPPVEPVKRSLKDRFLSLWQTLRTTEGLSDNDVRRAIDKALRAVVPGYMGIDEVYPDSGEVIYYACPGDEWMMMRQNYTLTGDDATLTDNAVQVEPVTTYEPVAEPTTAATKPCSCGGRQASEGQSTIQGDNDMKTKAERIAALAANKHSVVKDIKVLESVPDEVLKTLEDDATAKQTAEDTQVAADKKSKDEKDEKDRLATASAAAIAPATTAVLSTEDWLKTAPPEIRAMHSRETARLAAEKSELVSKLVACGTTLTKEQLEARSLEDLQTIAQFAKVEQTVQHVGVPAAFVAASAASGSYAPPDGYAKKPSA